VAKPFESAELMARIHAALRTKLRTDDLARQATLDTLTGMLNRATLDGRLDEHVALAHRGEPLGCAMVDIDHFKLLNDRHGHAAGDQVVREVARRIRSSVRLSDLVFRYGGEEFLVPLPGTNLEGAEVLGRNLLLAVSSTPIRLETADVPVAVSVGVAEWLPTMTSAGELTAAADEALYRAKTARARAARARHLERTLALRCRGQHARDRAHEIRVPERLRHDRRRPKCMTPRVVASAPTHTMGSSGSYERAP